MSLLNAAASQQLRDLAEEDPALFGHFLWELFREVYTDRHDPEYSEYIYKLTSAVLKFPEIVGCLAALEVQDRRVYEDIVSGMSNAKSSRSSLSLKIMHALYAASEASERVYIRKKLSRVLLDYRRVPNKSSNVVGVLVLFEKILLGLQGKEGAQKGAILPFIESVLVPLFGVNGWQVFDRQEPFIAVYWKALMGCLEAAISICDESDYREAAAGQIMKGILAGFPDSSAANSAKELLLWTGIGKFLSHVIREGGSFVRTDLEKKVLDRVIKSLISENANIVQAALSLWRNEAWKQFINTQGARVIKLLMPALLRGGRVHWNPTVNRMTVLVLDSLAEGESFDAETEASYADLFRYRETLKFQFRPTEESGDGVQATKSWEEALSARSTVCLRDLKYHDLVFGRELGRGAFGVVKYARAIEKKTSISSWPEYAVKMVELKYPNVLKEIAVLEKLTHPGIARLVSFFSLGSPPSIVAVLEYGALGDLHTHVTSHGALTEDEVRQVGAEVAGALQTIHALGFAYADVKPENIVIVFNRHVKLTDLGAVVPLTSAARTLVYHEKMKIRTGDWNKQQVTEVSYQELAEEYPDFVIEGTTAYMAPELFHHFHPTFLSDAWSFGALLFFLATVRLPAMPSDENQTVRFEMDRSPLQGLEVHSVVDRLMEIDVSKRLSIQDLDFAEFFAPIAPLVDAFSRPLTKQHLTNAGAQGTKTHDPWAKRQLSRVWTTLPADLDVPEEQSIQLSAIPATPEDLFTSWF